MGDKVENRVSGGLVGMKVKVKRAIKGKTLAQRELISKRRVRIQTTYVD